MPRPKIEDLLRRIEELEKENDRLKQGAVSSVLQPLIAQHDPQRPPKRSAAFCQSCAKEKADLIMDALKLEDGDVLFLRVTQPIHPVRVQNMAQDIREWMQRNGKRGDFLVRCLDLDIEPLLGVGMKDIVEGLVPGIPRSVLRKPFLLGQEGGTAP